MLSYAELSQPGLNFNYNLIYCAAGAVNLSIDWNKKSYSDYISFVAGTGTNKNSVFANPLFVNANITNPDFHLLSSSAAINAGNPATIPAVAELDLDGQNRKNGVIDCGADEYYAPNGIEENHVTTNLFTVFPNPACGEISIQSSDANMKNILVYDRMGKQIGIYRLENSKKQIDVSAFQKGIYYLVGFDKSMNQVGTQKLILE